LTARVVWSKTENKTWHIPNVLVDLLPNVLESATNNAPPLKKPRRTSEKRILRLISTDIARRIFWAVAFTGSKE
jgi:hypothetical protein